VWKRSVCVFTPRCAVSSSSACVPVCLMVGVQFCCLCCGFLARCTAVQAHITFHQRLAARYGYSRYRRGRCMSWMHIMQRCCGWSATTAAFPIAVCHCGMIPPVVKLRLRGCSAYRLFNAWNVRCATARGAALVVKGGTAVSCGALVADAMRVEQPWGCCGWALLASDMVVTSQA
jgi:hypothetical protein